MEGNDETEAALKVIAGMPLEGKVVSADAGLLRCSLVQAVVQKGAYIGLIKRNQPELRQALATWLQQVCPTDSMPHGRFERRQVWMARCPEDLSVYLGWGAVGGVDSLLMAASERQCGAGAMGVGGGRRSI